MKFQIIDLTEQYFQSTAGVAYRGFQHLSPDWLTSHEIALEEVEESVDDTDKISRIAIRDDGTVLGWVGASPEYGNTGWELHPLVVDPEYQGHRIGTALIQNLEMTVRARGGVMIYLLSDDEIFATSLSGIDLYENLAEKIASIQNMKDHPFEFYQKMGYTITGVIPDANGIGRPDILMCKRL